MYIKKKGSQSKTRDVFCQNGGWAKKPLKLYSVNCVCALRMYNYDTVSVVSVCSKAYFMRQNILMILLFIITFLLANQRGEIFLVHVSRQ